MTRRRDRSGVADAELWHAYAREVKPLGARPPPRARNPAPAEPVPPREPAMRPAPPRRAPLAELEAGMSADLDSTGAPWTGSGVASCGPRRRSICMA
jgi:hypothetical protein